MGGNEMRNRFGACSVRIVEGKGSTWVGLFLNLFTHDWLRHCGWSIMCILASLRIWIFTIPVAAASLRFLAFEVGSTVHCAFVPRNAAYAQPTICASQSLTMVAFEIPPSIVQSTLRLSRL